MRDRELISKVVSGHPGAFDELYYAYVDRVHRQVYCILGPDPEIDDVIQNAFIQIHKKIATYRFESAFSTWVHRIAINAALQHIRRRSRWRRNGQYSTDSLAQAFPGATARVEEPDTMIDRKLRVELFFSVVERLKPKKRVVFLLYEIEGHTLEEIANLVSVSPNTVASRLRAARREVRTLMEKRLRLVGESQSGRKLSVVG